MFFIWKNLSNITSPKRVKVKLYQKFLLKKIIRLHTELSSKQFVLPINKWTPYYNNFFSLYTLIGNRDNLSSLWFLFYIQQYYSHTLNYPVIVKNINTINLLPKTLLNHILNTLRFLNWKIYYLTNGILFIEMLYIALVTKNTNFLIKWIRFYFERINLKKHKKCFLFLKLIFSKLIWNYNSYFMVKGVHLSLKGKFAKAGSVRKSRRYIISGQSSRTSKQLGVYSKKLVIRTVTGVLGLKLSIFFYIWLLH